MILNNYPLVCTDTKKRVFISFYINKKRYRLYNSKRIGDDFNPNSFPEERRIEMGNILAYKVYEHLNRGGTLNYYRTNNLVCGELKDVELIKKAYDNKLRENYSVKYKEMLKWVYKIVKNHLNHPSNSINNLELLLDEYTSETSYNTIKRHINVLLNDAVKLGLKRNPIRELKSKREKVKLHQPIENISLLFDEIKKYNFNLWPG